MGRKIVLTVILSFLFVGVLTLRFKLKPVEANGTIYIRSDGSIEPSGTAISTTDNVTYVLTGNINDSIVVERDNIVLDGAGNTVQGDGSGKGIDLSGRDNVTIENIQIIEFAHAIYLNHSVSNTITESILTAINFEGISLYESSDNSIIANKITAIDWDGIVLYGSSGNKIAKNNLTSNYDGVRFYNSSNNTISGNSIKNNIVNGIMLSGSSDNIISGNNITANIYAGIYLYSSSENSIYQNNFVDNSRQVYDPSWYTLDVNSSTNIWDDGYPSGGNYWSDYPSADKFNGPSQNEVGSDGIGDESYFIDEDNTDNYPLVGMFSDFNPTSEYHVQTVCNSTISDFQFNGTVIFFNVTGEDGTTGFCRICIPHELMSPTYVVLINGELTEVPYEYSYDDATCIYFTYPHSTHEVIIIPEFPPFLILPLFMIATLLPVIVYRRRYTA